MGDLSMQTLSKREDVDVSGEEQEPPAERALPTALFLERDRQTFRQFLRIGIADVLARGETIDLDINEEFPRLIPVLCSYFTGEELTQLIGREMAARLFAPYRLEIVQNLFLESELQKGLHAFNEAGIAVILMRGQCWPTRSTRDRSCAPTTILTCSSIHRICHARMICCLLWAISFTRSSAPMSLMRSAPVIIICSSAMIPGLRC